MAKETLQLEDGKYTRILNVIIEELDRIPFKGCELQICWHVIRQTYGYNKLTDRISLTQFQDKLQRSRPTIIKGLRNLCIMNILLVNTGLLGKQYKLNKYYKTWKVVNTGLLVKRRGGLLVNTGLHTKDNTKDNNISTSIKKSSGTNKMYHSEPDNIEEVISLEGSPIKSKGEVEKAALKADVDRVIAEYEKQWVEIISKNKKLMPRNTIPATRAIVKNALRLYKADEIIAYMPHYFANNHYETTHWPIWVLCDKKILNQLKIEHEK